MEDLSKSETFLTILPAKKGRQALILIEKSIGLI
jgi:hypothetical protein